MGGKLRKHTNHDNCPRMLRTARAAIGSVDLEQAIELMMDQHADLREIKVSNERLSVIPATP